MSCDRMVRPRRPFHLRQRVASRLRHGGTTRTLVLLYHRVAEPEHDPQLLAVSPTHFAEHLEVLSSRLPILPLAAVRGAPAGVAITFDDGYADNLAAAERLAALGMAATIFTVAGLLGEEPWWDTLSRLALASSELPAAVALGVHGRRRSWQLAGEGAVDGAWHVLSGEANSPRTRLYRDLFAVLRVLPADERRAVLSQLAEQVKDPAADGGRILTPGEIEALVALPGIELGAHTCTHPVLSTLSPERQREEIVRGKAILEDVSGVSLSSFAYPFGSAGDYDAATVEIVRAAGFARACINDPVRLRSRVDRFRLPRFLVRDWNGDEFERRLRSWLPS